MTITEDYVSFEIAKLLKEKGFHEDCKCQYGKGGSIAWISCSNGNATTFARPTLQMTMKWLREVHGLFISIGNDELDYNWQIFDVKMPLESADMFLAVNGTLPVMSKYIDNGLVTADETAIPCWSLASLLGVLPKIHKLKPILDLEENSIQYSGVDLYIVADNPIDACYEMIIRLSELNLL